MVKWIIRFAFCASVAPAEATQLPELSSVEIVPYTRDGTVRGCALEFRIGFRDELIRQGALSVAIGTIGVSIDQTRVTPLFKVGLMDWQGPLSAGRFEQAKLAASGLRKGTVFLPLLHAPCENTNFMCATIGNKQWSEFIREMPFYTITFRRPDLSRDYSLTLQLSADKLADHDQCILSMLKAAQGSSSGIPSKK